ncbi:2-oxoacid:acceptor oxidoreductase family protein [Salipaludibacillus daqingensis]|uniref:2-oxoacid:acceptor oxidoreductase family protein n=1 Tax=Salipaludibacillus daqingensis TaxID=3041001 RepID=UPI00247474ED|nr:2-oxoacid:acceptor oxidoreductase family protein [Salipaludibacillus daqingensis]
MKQELIIAGFGGQGVMSMGQLLAYAGMKEGKHVSWLPSYGPEQRGGTANVSVVISDKEVGSPVIDKPTSVIALNNPSFEKFEPMLIEGGDLFTNSNLVDISSKREDIYFLPVPATEIAKNLKMERVAGMVLLGAFITKTKVLSKDSLLEALINVLGEKKKHLIGVNEEAILAGENLIEKKLFLTK